MFISIYRSNIKVENLHYDEKESVLKLSLHNECKSCDLVFKFSSVDKPEEKEKHLKAMLFNLARIAQEKSVSFKCSYMILIQYKGKESEEIMVDRHTNKHTETKSKYFDGHVFLNQKSKCM